MLIGRSREQEHLARLLSDARTGRSRAVVLRGAAGIGKTALLDDVATGVSDMRIIRGVGIESESELPFSGLHLLLYPFADRFDALPGQQAAALRSAFGLAEAPVHDRFLIGAAVLTLLSDLAGERPLLCLVDDAQWLDRASSDALFFAARRLHADAVAMIFAVRDSARPFPVPGVEVLRVDGLTREFATALVASRAPELGTPERTRLLDEAEGNPLALIELADALAAAGSTGAARLVHEMVPLRVGGQVQEAFRRQLGELPARTRLLLLLVAAAGTADPSVVLRAAGSLGLGAADLGPAEEARLVTVSRDEIRFRHPLIRAVSYQDGAHHMRIAAHDALAGALAGEEHADRRAWHRAAAATGPDEPVAEALEQAAHRAGHRGGTAAVAAAYERAARLSTDQARKARRIVLAARAAYDAGQPDRASRLATEAVSLTEEPAIAAEATYVRAQVAYERTSPAADAALALDSATLITGRDPERAVSMLTEAVWAARDACAHELVRRAVKQLETLRLPPAAASAPAAAALIGYGRLVEGDVAGAVPPMRALVAATRAGVVPEAVERVIAGFMAVLVADDDAATEVLSALSADVRGEGALGWLPYVLEPLAIARVLRGDFRGAAADLAEAISLATDIGMEMQITVLECVSVRLTAVTGDAAHCRALAAEALPRAAPHPTNAALASWGLGLLDLAAGRFAEAVERLSAVCTGPAAHDMLVQAVPDLVEAAVRDGRDEVASARLPAFADWAGHVGGPATALVLRCRALLTEGDEAEEHYLAAVRGHGAGDRAYDAARTRLLYGEWLRRRRRRTAARDQLAAARDAFARLGAAPWAARAQAELEVLGDRPTARADDADLLKRLTPQELQVVRLAAAGHSNREIGARLYLSPRTVGHHLYNAFPKIGITRRMELAHLDL